MYKQKRTNLETKRTIQSQLYTIIQIVLYNYLLIQPGPKDCRHLYTVLRAALVPVSLRLWHARSEVRSDRGGKSKAEIS